MISDHLKIVKYQNIMRNILVFTLIVLIAQSSVTAEEVI